MEKIEKCTIVPGYNSQCEVNHTAYSSCVRGTDIFVEMISDILENIVYQSNLFGTQKGKNLCLNENE